MLGNARLDLSDHYIDTGETADILQAVELLEFPRSGYHRVRN